MTSQIILMNRSGAAVASDSISTLVDGDGEYLASIRNSEKVYTLPAGHNVIILNNAVGSISGAPLGLVLALWIKKLPSKPLDTVWQYIDSFLNYLEDANPETYPEWSAEFRAFIYDHLRPISEHMAEIFPELRPFSEETKELCRISPVFARGYKAKLAKRINSFLKELDTARPQTLVDSDEKLGLQESRQKTACQELDTDSIVDLWFPDEVAPIATKKRLKANIYKLLNRVEIDRNSEDICRLVFVGFGELEHYASVVEIGIEAKIHSIVRWRGLGSANLKEQRSVIYYLAQTSAIRNFVNGVHDNFLANLRENVPQAVVEDRLGDFESPEEMKDSERQIWFDIGTSVHHKLERYMAAFQKQSEEEFKTKLDFMPTSELAAVAQSLVSLEILSAENRTGPNTVGGNTVVVTIDISQGVKWIQQ